jgi:hypothetical protein
VERRLLALGALDLFTLIMSLRIRIYTLTAATTWLIEWPSDARSGLANPAACRGCLTFDTPWRDLDKAVAQQLPVVNWLRWNLNILNVNSPSTVCRLPFDQTPLLLRGSARLLSTPGSW